jgi:chromosomal replication initiation ATPase DnaA
MVNYWVAPGLENKVEPINGLNNTKLKSKYNDITLMVASYYGVNSDDLFSTSRRREYALPRQICMHFQNAYNKKHFRRDRWCDIARYWDKNHATIIHAVKAINNQMHEKFGDSEF